MPGPRNRKVTLVLAAGLSASVLCCLAFYLLLATQHGVGNLGGSGTPGYAERLSRYTAWLYARIEYKRGYAFSFLGVLVFAAATALSLFPTAAKRASFLLLNLYFAWTSHIVSDVSQPAAKELSNLISIQDIYLWRSLDLTSITANTQVVADFEALAMFGILTALTAIGSLESGKSRAALLGIQAAALALVMLGAEIAIFDYREFYLHVTDAQVLLSLAPWFTNADLLVSGLVVLVASSSLLRFHRFGHPLF